MKYCQMPTDDGIEECGFVIGGKCRANQNDIFWITPDFLRRIKVVGCQSYQRYFDYDERRKRFGEEAVGHDKTHGESTEGRKPDCGERKTHLLQELPEQEMGRDRKLGEGQQTFPVPVLQEGSDNQKDSTDYEPIGRNLKCGFCDEPAVVTDCHIHYCKKHGKILGVIK